MCDFPNSIQCDFPVLRKRDNDKTNEKIQDIKKIQNLMLPYLHDYLFR